LYYRNFYQTTSPSPPAVKPQLALRLTYSLQIQSSGFAPPVHFFFLVDFGDSNLDPQTLVFHGTQPPVTGGRFLIPLAAPRPGADRISSRGTKNGLVWCKPTSALPPRPCPQPLFFSPFPNAWPFGPCPPTANFSPKYSKVNFPLPLRGWALPQMPRKNLSFHYIRFPFLRQPVALPNFDPEKIFGQPEQ